jgi:hypothetical protein
MIIAGPSKLDTLKIIHYVINSHYSFCKEKNLTVHVPVYMYDMQTPPGTILLRPQPQSN